MGRDKKLKTMKIPSVNLFKNLSWIFSAEGALLISSFIKSVLIIRFLDVEKFGIYGIILASVGTINQFVDFRIKEAIIRYVIEYFSLKKVEKALGMINLCYLLNFLTGIIAFLIILLISPLIAQFLLKDIGLKHLIIIYSVILIISALNPTSEGIFQAFEKFRNLSIISNIGIFFELSFIVTAIIINGELIGIFIAILISKFVNSFILNIMAYKIVKEIMGKNWFAGDIKLLRPDSSEIIRFLINTNITAFLKIFVTNIDILLLSYFKGPYASGIYKIALSIIAVLFVPITSLNKVLYPWLSKFISNKELKKFKKLSFCSIFVSILYSIGGLSLLWFTLNKVVMLVYGEQYTLVEIPFKLMYVGIVMGICSSVLRSILLALYDTITTNIGFLLAGFVWLTFGILLTKAYGYNGTAITYSISTFTLGSYSFIRLLTHLKGIEK